MPIADSRRWPRAASEPSETQPSGTLLPAAPPRRVLVVDDDPIVRELLRRFLVGRGCEIFEATDSEQAIAVLGATEIDVVLVDLVLHGSSGLDLVKKVRADFGALPIVIITGYPSLEAAVEAMRSGASDFVIKPVDGPTLELRIEKAMELESTRRQANTDGLTGLYNHRYFQQRLGAEVDRCRRYGKALSLALFDLDHFKMFNDRFGHLRGDEAMIDVARVLRRHSRTSDVVARYGGEEFAAILPESGAPEAEIFAERVRRQIAERALVGAEGEQLGSLTISCGIASLVAGESPRDLVERTDVALYRAKEAGRNRVMIAEQPPPARG